MTDQADRFDRFASGYAHYWAPVLAPAVRQLLDEVEPRAGRPERILDVGTGTGQLALGALDRWPRATVDGVDVSTGMIAVARAEAERALGRRSRTRFSIEIAPADQVPFEDDRFDLAMSSFVYQLVPSRARAYREARRVLRPGGILAFVSWLDDDRVFRPDQLFDEILERLDIEPRVFDGRPGDLPSVERAAGELRHAGFSDVSAHAGTLEHTFGVDDYVEFMADFDEESLFDELEPAMRKRLETTLRDELTRLTPDELTMRFPIVFVMGRRSR
ncbi:MAG TPA: class I SAM-dependent methyltransferase [Actinomycetota bacterium]|nr:class I SAM-dependent methyltransferase [Actinomycetota bacterium]